MNIAGKISGRRLSNKRIYGRNNPSQAGAQGGNRGRNQYNIYDMSIGKISTCSQTNETIAICVVLIY